jgi:DNA repair exonuclease SbcCD ATPase subunit
MKINYLRLVNFKSVRDKEFFFTKPVSILIGKNGSGKSSVIDAITYLLTDELYESISEYINWSDGVETSELYIKFTHLGVEYDYKVILKLKGSTERLLKVSNSTEEYKNSDAVKKIKELYNPKLILYSSISTQHEATSLLFENPSDRLKKLKQILGLERIEEISQNLKDDIETLKLRCLALDSEISVLKQVKFNYQIVQDLEDITEINKKFSKLSESKREYERLLESYDQNKKDIEEYEKKVLRKETLEKEITETNEKIKKLVILPSIEIDDELEKTNKVELKKYEKLENEFDLTNKSYTQYLKDSKNYEDKIKSIEDKISKIQIKRIGKCEVSDDEINTIQEEVNSLNSSRLQLESSLELCKEGKCSKCGTPFEEDPSHIENELKKNSELLSEKSKSLSESKEKITKFKDDKSANDLNLANKKSLEENKEEFEKLLNDLPKIEKPSEDFRASLEKCRQIEKDFTRDKEKNQEIDKKNKNSDKEKLTLEALIESKKIEIDSLLKLVEPKKLERPIFEEESEYKETEKLITVYEEKKKQREEALKFNSDVKTKEEENKKSIEDKENEYNDCSSRQRVLTETRKLLDKDFSSYVIDEGSTYIKTKMNEFFTKTYGRYLIDFKKDNKSVHFFYSPDDKIYKSVGVAAGFEKQALSLSFRVALTSIQNLGFYLLDEIDSSAEDENSLNVFENLLNEEYEQIICVTHKEVSKEYLVNEKEAEVFEMVS